MKYLSAVVLVLLLVASAFGWNYRHEHSLSPEVRAAVVAAVGENESTVSVILDLHAAKLAVRTKRDEELVDRLDKFVSLLQQANRDRDRGFSLSLTMELAFPTECGGGYVPTIHSAVCTAALKKQIEQDKKAREEGEGLLAKSREENTKALALYTQLRADVGLPSLKSN